MPRLIYLKNKRQGKRSSFTLMIMEEDVKIRLQKVLAQRGVASRRAAETMISEGRITVNGQGVIKLGAKVDPFHDDIKIDGSDLPNGG